MKLKVFISKLAKSLDAAAREHFTPFDRRSLEMSMFVCGMTEYPPLVGPEEGEYASLQMLCAKCGHTYLHHPLDYRLIGHGDRPFLTVLCDGRRVKL